MFNTDGRSLRCQNLEVKLLPVPRRRGLCVLWYITNEPFFLSNVRTEKKSTAGERTTIYPVAVIQHRE